jgi:hypothetical protein
MPSVEQQLLSAIRISSIRATSDIIPNRLANGSGGSFFWKNFFVKIELFQTPEFTARA